MPLRAYGNRFSFKKLFADLQDDLVAQPSVDVGEWQSIHRPTLMKELRNVSFAIPIPANMDDLAQETGAHRPWAEDHFEERVGGQPLNPSPSEAWWPFAQKKNDSSNGEHKSEGEAFSHTYPERMWPKHANETMIDLAENDPMRDPELVSQFGPMHGIRFDYGDLNDVVKQLLKTPLTRQAFLPIWFPEDTGAVHGKRVPCTLGYHFAIRDGILDITYYMRSTDLLRHFQDDIYLAGRLAQWIVQRLNTHLGPVSPEDGPLSDSYVKVGELIFHTANLHIFEGDVPMIEYRKSQGQLWIE